MYPDLKDKVALVTGAGKKNGIGYAIARALAAAGSHVVIADLGCCAAPESPVRTGTEPEMEALAHGLAQEYGVTVQSVSVDVCDGNAVAAMANTMKERFGRVDVLCNNAGASFGVPNAFHTYAETDWMRTIDVNLHSVFRVTRAVLPLMLGRPGSIVNTASRAGKVPPIFNGAYAVAKAGVIMLTRVMAKELAGAGIRANAICPGQIRTDLEAWRFELEAKFFNTTAREREQEMCRTIPLGRIGTPEEAANLALFLASSASSYITGQALNVSGGQLMEL